MLRILTILATVLVVDGLFAGEIQRMRQAEQTLQLLRNRSVAKDRKLLIGQNIGHSNGRPSQGYQDFFQQLPEQTGKTPAILAIDYGYDRIPKRITRSNQFAIAHAQEGGLVSISMHPPNPWHGSKVRDRRIDSFENLMRSGTAANGRWRDTLDRVAAALAELRDNNVVVLFRPFHEMNGDWFWWGAGDHIRRKQFVQLWQSVHRYLTEKKNLNNLLWVYAPSIQAEVRSPIEFYPGDEFVDVVGMDYYADHVSDPSAMNKYQWLVSLGKPIGFSEIGPLKQRNGRFNNMQLASLRNHFPRVGFAVVWHSWPGARVAITDNKKARQLMTDERVICREDLKAGR